MEPHTHTAEVGDKLYDILILKSFSEEIPIENVLTETLRDAVAEGNTYWLDTEGKMFGPAEILRDWDAAQHNPLWTEHIESIKHADLDNPLWIAPNGFVFDGMHRLTKAFIEGVKEIKVRRFTTLPEDAVVV